MISLATADNERFRVSDCELHRSAPSYTFDTVSRFRDELGPKTTIYWLIGADSINELAHWHRIDELIDICHLATMYRGGYGKPSFGKYTNLWGSQRVAKLDNDVIETPSIDISSTEIRRRLAAGQNVGGMLAPQVEAYIRQHHLYDCAC